MPWKIVNLDYNERPHLHLKDPNAPIHLRSYFEEKRVEIGLGGDEPDTCFVRASVTPDDVIVQATKFEELHVQILQSIFASLDVEPQERTNALAWMKERIDAARKEGSPERFLPGNIDAFPPPTGWPYDLTDEALLDSLRDNEAVPSTRLRALRSEARRRNLIDEPVPARRREPEVVHRRS